MFHCRLVLNGAPPVGFLLISCQAGFACNPRLHSASSCFSSSQTACRPFWRQGGMPGCLKYKVSQAFSSSRHLLYDNKIFLTFSPPRVSRSWWPSNRGCWGLVQQRPTAPQIDSSASPGERTLCMYAEQGEGKGSKPLFHTLGIWLDSRHGVWCIHVDGSLSVSCMHYILTLSQTHRL